MTSINSTAKFNNDDDPTLATTSLEFDRTNSQIILGKNLTTTPSYVYISPNSISNGVDFTTFPQIVNLANALSAVELPPVATTFKVNDTIMVSATVGEEALLTPSGLTFNTLANPSIIQNSGGYDLTVQSSSQLVLNSYDNINMNAGVGLLVSAGDYISMTANNDFISFQADDDITLNSAGLGNINLQAPNINSYGFSIPICFDVYDTNVINYGGGQTLTNVFITNCNIPPNFIVDTPQSGYTSNKWKIDFTLQTWNAGGQNNSTDKALAYYINFNDQSSNFYTPVLFNDITPYCKHNNNSTWTAGGSNAEFQSHTWTDYIDFSALVGSGSGNLPLKLNLYMGSDNPKDFTFKLLCSLTRTNILPP